MNKLTDKPGAALGVIGAIDRDEAAARALRAIGLPFIEGTARVLPDGTIQCTLKGVLDVVTASILLPADARVEFLEPGEPDTDAGPLIYTASGG